MLSSDAGPVSRIPFLLLAQEQEKRPRHLLGFGRQRVVEAEERVALAVRVRKGALVRLRRFGDQIERRCPKDGCERFQLDEARASGSLVPHIAILRRRTILLGGDDNQSGGRR